LSAPQLLPLWLLFYILYIILYFRAKGWRFAPKSSLYAVLTLWLLPLLKEFWLLKGAIRYRMLIV
ncbi:MAG: hypothetical protein KAT35_02620, partial [Candidatus Aenigmarchaeota archaeon]|nr:hypothetical protein [Candidatus Aenigmarchaeota archaeon]